MSKEPIGNTVWISIFHIECGFGKGERMYLKPLPFNPGLTQKIAQTLISR
jgi:hypothetical protein